MNILLEILMLENKDFLREIVLIITVNLHVKLELFLLLCFTIVHLWHWAGNLLPQHAIAWIPGVCTSHMSNESTESENIRTGKAALQHHPSFHPQTSLCWVAATGIECDCDNIDVVSHKELFPIHTFGCVQLRATPRWVSLYSVSEDLIYTAAGGK